MSCVVTTQSKRAKKPWASAVQLSLWAKWALSPLALSHSDTKSRHGNPKIMSSDQAATASTKTGRLRSHPLGNSCPCGKKPVYIKVPTSWYHCCMAGLSLSWLINNEWVRLSWKNTCSKGKGCKGSVWPAKDELLQSEHLPYHRIFYVEQGGIVNTW